ncbi:MAG: hypothetical protein HYU37_01790 [Acidobacteria bacterium]|nr:hypothetical protein [Acidobacteriota bacterium]
MRTKLAVLLVGLGVLWVSAPAVAHHAIGGEYDPNKSVTLKGTVTKIEWTNPHARIYFDVTGPDGTVVNWNVELAARSALARQGWTARSLNIGDTVTIEGILARSGVNMVNARSVVLPDGKKVFSGENQ